MKISGQHLPQPCDGRRVAGAVGARQMHSNSNQGALRAGTAFWSLSTRADPPPTKRQRGVGNGMRSMRRSSCASRVPLWCSMGAEARGGLEVTADAKLHVEVVSAL